MTKTTEEADLQAIIKDDVRVSAQAAAITRLRALVAETGTLAARRADLIEAQVSLIERQAAEITRLRAALKWNIERDGDDLLICEGGHERHEGCTMQRWVKAEKVATARREGMEMPSEFLDWMKDQMPSGTYVHNPEWWAIKVWKAAIRAAAGEVKP
mgnify:CR=1 FL=1